MYQVLTYEELITEKATVTNGRASGILQSALNALEQQGFFLAQVIADDPSHSAASMFIFHNPEGESKRTGRLYTF